MVQAHKIRKQLLDNLNANAQVTAWCTAIVNTTVAPTTSAWYVAFMLHLAAAKEHANSYLNVIGPDAWSTLPNAVVNYSSTHNNAMGDVQNILNSVGNGELSSDQINTIVQLFTACAEYLTQLLGTSTDTNLSVPPPTQPTIWGTRNDLTTFRMNITQDNENLTTGKNSAVVDVALAEADEIKMQVLIDSLNRDIGDYNKVIELTDIGIGVSIFTVAVSLYLMPVTFGFSAVTALIGIAGLGASIAENQIYSKKVTADLTEIANDQAELTTDQQEVNALNGIIDALARLGPKAEAAEAAVESAVGSYVALIEDTNTTIAALNKADSGTAKGILEKVNIQDAMSDWTNLSNLAQGILNSTLNSQVLTPPAATARVAGS